jgi:hypothetical protein
MTANCYYTSRAACTCGSAPDKGDNKVLLTARKHTDVNAINTDFLLTANKQYLSMDLL